ncbi:MAG: nitroreductase family protein [Synergistaceae bacterium]|nr:nitroreductase family protein [Synergistaceae bacterium]
MLRRVILFLSVIIGCFTAAGASWADIKLPEPKRAGGEGIFVLLERRASGTRGAFPRNAVADEELSAILWAATGRNRDGGGWTVPMAGGRPPYVKIYAVRPDGVFLYDWDEHSLVEISSKNVLSDISGDGFVRESPCVLIFVTDAKNLGSMSRANGNNALMYTASGAMSQNVYLAADSLGISTRYMISMNAGEVTRELRLEGDETPICIMPLGKR